MRLSLVLCFCSIGRQGVQGVQTARPALSAGMVPKYVLFVYTVQYIPTYPVFPGPPCRCFVVRCMFCKAEEETDRPIEPDCPAARSVRPGERSKVEPFTDRRGPKGPALCAVHAWSNGASPLAHPIAPGLARGAWGKHRQAPGAGVALS